ncbi:3-phosphoshikimate 1-carboxyvinyltransferase, partial [Vibrio parahaemolyticus]|nr:3-phosphoshikimate 1-carboxyvinyltransferase [Vibrio parahaemolyticus]
NEIQITNPNTLISKDIFVPGDISSAAYFIALALITDESSLIIRDVGVNKTRTHILELWKKMGGKIEIINKRNFNGEDVSDIVVKSSKLKGIVLSEEDVSLCIDEIPILAVTAAFDQGETKIYGAKELRVKESDRLYLTYTNLKNMKAHVEIDENNLSIVGGNEIFGSDIET